MGSIPVRSTKKDGCSLASVFFGALLRIRPRFINTAQTVASRLRETANSRQKTTCSHFSRYCSTRKPPFLRIGNKMSVNFERYRRIAMPHIFAYGLNRNEYNIKSDDIGNPCLYKDNMLKWKRGRLPAKYGDNSYSYDSDDVRIKKETTNDILYTYFTKGTHKHHEEYGTHKN